MATFSNGHSEGTFVLHQQALAVSMTESDLLLDTVTSSSTLLGLPPCYTDRSSLVVTQPALVARSHGPGLGEPGSRFWLCPDPALAIDPQQAVGLSVLQYLHLQNSNGLGLPSRSSG